MLEGSQTAPVALVAGASRGLGLLIARDLGQRGHRLVICSRTASELKTGADWLRAYGFDVTEQVCDVGDVEAVNSLVDRVESEVGPIEVLVCVAGVIQAGPLAAVRRRHFTEAISTMLWGPVNTALAVAEPMQRRGHGRIGVIASVGGLIAAPHLLPYSTAKFGAVGFSRGLRSELAGTGVSVTTVAPGLMRTGSHVRAKFVGDPAKEYAWFAVAATMPLLSADAERSARRIVSGILAGRAVVTITPLAWLAPRVDALLPELTSVVLSATTRLLPRAPRQPELVGVDGREAAARQRRPARSLVRALTGLGRRAAERFNEL